MERSYGGTNEPGPGVTEEDLEKRAFALIRAAFQRQPSLFTPGLFAQLSDALDDIEVEDESEGGGIGGEEEEEDSDGSDSDEEFETVAVGGTLDVNQGKVGAVCDATIKTTGLATCIAVGKTGLFQTRRYSALIHWDGISPSTDAGDLLSWLDDAIDWKMQAVAGTTGLLTDVKYLAVGGRASTANEQQAIHAEVGALDVTEHYPTEPRAVSSATISDTGGFSWETVEGRE
jgi:hypothetical protein